MDDEGFCFVGRRDGGSDLRLPRESDGNRGGFYGTQLVGEVAAFGCHSTLGRDRSRATPRIRARSTTALAAACDRLPAYMMPAKIDIGRTSP
jgi:hypothetical protein